MTIALGSKWRAERRIVKLAYFDTLTGLPNRAQSHNRLVRALQAAKLEISESVVMADEAWAERTINQLKQLGISLALDDFGIGYSRFGRLRNLAVDRLKIGRSFVTSITEGGDDRAIASAIIATSRSLRINVTAEGVENFPQLAFLQEQDCQDAQGFLLSGPLQAEESARAPEALGRARRRLALATLQGAHRLT